jgi:membrane protein DedA with SNARE-associated domain
VGVIAIEYSAVIHMFETYGYISLFGFLVFGIVGLPLPDETLLTVVGYLVSIRYLNYWVSILVGTLGSIVGITFSYLLGIFLGREVIHRFGKYMYLTPERVASVEKFMDKYGKLTLFFGYFIPGIRQVTAIVAGISKMNYRQFAIVAYLGGLLWVTTFITLGRFVGMQLHGIGHMFHRFRFLILTVLVLMVVTILIYRYVKARKNKRQVS